MPQIEITDALHTKLTAFIRVIDIVAETKPEDQVNYAELVLLIGIERMLRDIFPSDNKLLQDTIIQMFDRNPPFVADFIYDILEAGTPRKEVRESWNVNRYIQ